MKRKLVISMELEFDHTGETVDAAFPGANFYRAKQMAIYTLPMRKHTEAIEDILFNNKEPLQTRILAIFLAGFIRGQSSPPKISIGIIQKPPEGNT